MNGTVTKIQYKKRKHSHSYGFIESEGKNYYFVLSQDELLNVGDKVNFVDGINEKGYIASNVTRGVTMTGLVDYLQVKKSRKSKYGFISGEDGKMYWFSLNNLRLKVGDKVTFTGGTDEKGYIATSVSVAES